jgi:hypothetical protein
MVRDEGSLILLTPLSSSAREFVEQRIGSDNGFQPYWPTVVIERRLGGETNHVGRKGEPLRARC